MTTHSASGSPWRRIRWTFWSLVGVAVLSVGALSQGLTAKPSPLTGLLVGGSGITAIGSLALAARVMIGVERARRQARRAPTAESQL